MSKPEKKESQTPLSIIQQINSGQINPRLLKISKRQECVEVFFTRGYTRAQIAEILKRSTKTIQRDVWTLQIKNSLVPDNYLIKRAIGRLNMAADTSSNHLIRLAQDKNASVRDRAYAAYLAFRVISETTKIHQSIGLLSPEKLPNDQQI